VDLVCVCDAGCGGGNGRITTQAHTNSLTCVSGVVERKLANTEAAVAGRHAAAHRRKMREAGNIRAFAVRQALFAEYGQKRAKSSGAEKRAEETDVRP
jgi:hypothetical protein